MPSLLLDPAGDAPLPAGHHRLGTEAAWLRLAVDLPANELAAPPVLVSGRDLCAWAERWWLGRGGCCETIQSPTQHLLNTCPTLTPANAQGVLQELGPGWATHLAPWSLDDVLQTLYPTFGPDHDPTLGWAARPTSPPARAALAAHWLLYTADRPQPWPAYHLPLLTQQRSTWTTADTAALFPLGAEEACTLLRVWLGLAPAIPGYPDPARIAGPFPAAVPPAWRAQARTLFTGQLTELNQTNLTLDELRSRLARWWQSHNNSAIPATIRELAAAQYADFILARPQLLQPSHLHELLPILGTAPQAQELQNALPPPEPTELPSTATPAAALQWVTAEYLPYRRWQAGLLAASAVLIQRVSDLAAQFESWVLSQYPVLLVAPNAGLLHIHQAESLRFSRTREVTLWVVPDGLGWLDAVALGEELHTLGAGHLTQPQATACLGLLPTITSLTKQPLLHSTTARALSRAQPNMVRRERPIPGHLAPSEFLREAQPGDLFIWTPPDPDRAYHEQFDPGTIQQRVSSLLKVLAQQLAAAAQAVPAALAFRLVVATDHGRQLGSSTRSIAVPAGCESHGRAAYAANGNPGFTPAPADLARPELAWLEPETFGLPYWAATVRGNAAFRTNNTDATGLLHFPHGGLWPEEVVVPWLVTERVAAAAPLTARISGHGLARRSGELTLKLTNPSTQSYALVALTINGPGGFSTTLPLDGHILPATATHTQPLALHAWPTPAQAAALQVRLQLTDDQARPTELADFIIQLSSEDFEEAPDLDLNF